MKKNDFDLELQVQNNCPVFPFQLKMARVALLITILVVCMLGIEAKPLFFGLLRQIFGGNRRHYDDDYYDDNDYRPSNKFNSFNSINRPTYYGSSGYEAPSPSPVFTFGGEGSHHGSSGFGGEGSHGGGHHHHHHDSGSSFGGFSFGSGTEGGGGGHHHGGHHHHS